MGIPAGKRGTPATRTLSQNREIGATRCGQASPRVWPIGVKNGPDALEMRCLFYPRKQTSVSYAADCDVIACYGRPKLTDKHLAYTIHCIDS